MRPKPAHYCTDPRCLLCRTDDELAVFLNELGVAREDIASGNVWPETEGEEE